MQIGIDSFAAALDDDTSSISTTDSSERLQNLIEQIELADHVGLDIFGVGEHHRQGFLDSAPAIILGAAAARTKRIRLTSAVTVLSAADPVRVFQEFATLDLLSQDRAEMVVDRGSFIEAFPLFGLRLDDYNTLFSEKLELLLKIRNNEHVHDSKMLPELIQSIIKSNSATAIGKLFADGAYDSNETFRYLSDNGILPCIKVRKRMLELDGKKKGTRLGIFQLYLRKRICKSGRIA